jgi:hypothetical protein
MHTSRSIHEKNEKAKQRASQAFKAIKVSETFRSVKYINLGTRLHPGYKETLQKMT